MRFNCAIVCLLVVLLGSGCTCATSHQLPDAALDTTRDQSADSVIAVDGAADAGDRCVYPLAHPQDPGRCSITGDECSSTGGCGWATSCECDGAQWHCLQAVGICPPDIECSPGVRAMDPCSVDGDRCGSCCGSTHQAGFGPFVCRNGQWTPDGDLCADVRCGGETLCPVDPENYVGTSCRNFVRQSCGDPCCGSAWIVCEESTWVVPSVEPGCPETPCPTNTCGRGQCNADEACVIGCGPTDGIAYGCRELPEGCSDCGCIALEASESCQMVNGFPQIGFAPGIGCG